MSCAFLVFTLLSALSYFFFFNDTPTTEIYTLSLHDALPISQNQRYGSSHIGATAKDISNVVTDAASGVVDIRNILCRDRKSGSAGMPRPISYAVFCLKKKTSRSRRHSVFASWPRFREKGRSR